MGNTAQMQTQAAAPAVVNLGAMKAKHRTGRDGDPSLPKASPAETYGVNMPGLQTGEIFSPVEARYESLSVDGTKKAYQELNAALDGLASQVARTMERIVPYLARMQSLLSQRGADRKKVLKKAGLPKWTQWAEGYAKNLDCTVRTIQLHIKHLREGRVCPTSVQAAAAEKRADSSGDPKPPDWKTTLFNLVNALEQCGDKLPVNAKDALHAAQELLGAEGKAEATSTGPASFGTAEGERGEADSVGRYWLTPRDVYAALDDEFDFDFDSCPYPRPEGFDGLAVPWGRCSYVNPPFVTVAEGGRKVGMTAWVRKAIEEQAKGNTSVLVYPQHGWVHMLVQAGAELRSLGKVNWIDIEDETSSRAASSPIMAFILRGLRDESRSYGHGGS